MDIITQNLVDIERKIEAKIGAKKVKLVAVSKYASVEEIRKAYTLGIRDFGENKVQLAAQKATELEDLKELSWHFLGHLQTNKAKQALEIFDWIHTVDSLKLLKLLERLSQEKRKKLKLCFQVKLVPDQNKYGLSSEELFDLLSDFLRFRASHNFLELKGLMTILPLNSLEKPPEERVRIFRSLKVLLEKVNQKFELNFSELSMGMSSDYQEALQAGATILRIGGALFKRSL